MAIPRNPNPRKGYSRAEQERDRRGREIEKLRAKLEQLRPEYGLRIDYVSTLREERPVSDTLADAQTERDRIAARPDVVSCTVIGWSDGEREEMSSDAS